MAAPNGDDRFNALSVSPPFLTRDTLTVTYPRLNPLRIDVTTVSREAAGVSGSVIMRLRALLALSAVLVPPAREAAIPPIGAPGVSADTCSALLTARADAEALAARLWVTQRSVTVAARVSSWRQSIDDAFGAGLGGPASVSAAVSRIDEFVTQLDTQLDESDRIMARIAETIARTTSDQPCETSARAVYLVIDLANPRARMADLRAVRSAAISLRDSLWRDFGAAATEKWHEAGYRVAEMRPTSESTSRVTIRVTRLQFDVDDSSGALVAMEDVSGSDTLVAQRFSRFGREFAVASVISSITRQDYGTTTNEDGFTVVGRLPRATLSMEPAVLASFVCRCRTGPLLAPMLQAGIATSKDSPALLGGGGIRLIGLPKGDVALGAGGMIGWVKDLGTLQVGDRVGGTSDIEADLEVRNPLRVVRRVAGTSSDRVEQLAVRLP